MDLRAPLVKAIDILSMQGVDVPLDIWGGAIRSGALKAGGGDLGAINAEYHDAITEALITYLEGGSVTGPRNSFKRAMIQAFGDAWDLGWGGEVADADALEWFNARVTQELSYIDGLFAQAKELRKDAEADTLAWVNERADGYTQTVASIYNAALMWAKKNQMVTWQYGDTDHCSTCEGLNGKRHRISWFISRDYIPRKPGANLECGGYRCMCSLVTDNGDIITV